MEQQTLDGDTVPVQRDEKTTTTITWKSEFFKISLKQKDYENLLTGTTGEDSESFIMKRMKLHKGFPVSTAGKVFKEELRKLKDAIMEDPGDTGSPGSEEEEKAHDEEKEPGDEPKEEPEAPGSVDEKENETEKPQEPEIDQDEQITALITNLMAEEMSEPMEDYLVNNFKPAVIFKLAEKLHIKVRKNELPQKTAFAIATRIKALKEKPNTKR